MFWALPVLWLIIAVKGRTRYQARPHSSHGSKPRRQGYASLILCGLFFTGDLITLHWSFELTSVANAILFLNAQPIHVVLGAWLLFGERPTKKILSSVIVALSGILLMVGESARLDVTYMVGDLLGIVAGLCYAGYILTASRLRDDWSSADINIWTVSIACPCLLATAIASDQALQPEIWKGWILMVSLGVISQAVGQSLIIWGLATVGVAFSSVSLLLAPIASAVFAWLFLSEALTAQQLIGMAVVLVGIYFADRSQI
mgnify:CR=1 FL=1|tara:strand:- start:909 stop:1685 length:777 start_codon:yes stop_codon:yes gene_type:complete